MDNTAVIVIDMLADLVTGELKCDRAQRIIPNIAALIAAARSNKIPVVYSNDAHYEQDFELVNRWGKHAIKGTLGAEVIPELKPAEGDFTVEKRAYSGFYETGLDSLLRSLYNGNAADTLVLTGLHANLCVRHTAADAFFRGYKMVVPKDGVEAFTQKEYEEGLEYLNYAYGAKIAESVDDVIREQIRR